jgi:hypothetical protein
MASPWPLFVALGLPISELGILFDVPALSIGGLILLVGSAAGMAHEAGYARTTWTALAVGGVLLVPLGGLFLYADLFTNFVPEGVRLLSRGWAIVIAAAVLLAASLVGHLSVGRSDPF